MTEREADKCEGEMVSEVVHKDGKTEDVERGLLKRLGERESGK